MSKVAILVGGLGTRLREIVNNVPKPLAPINGKPFLFLVFDYLNKVKSISEVILLTGYMHEKIVDACESVRDNYQFNIVYSQEDKPMGTGGALKLASKHLISESSFILMNGDSYCPTAINALINHSIEDTAVFGAIAVSEVAFADRFGVVQFDRDMRIINFNEKVVNNIANSKFVNAGVYKLSNKIFAHIVGEEFCSLEKDIFPRLICLNNDNQLPALTVSIIEDQFDDIGLVDSYIEFSKKFLK